jgi:hypothetical protein
LVAAAEEEEDEEEEEEEEEERRERARMEEMRSWRCSFRSWLDLLKRREKGVAVVTMMMV